MSHYRLTNNDHQTLIFAVDKIITCSYGSFKILSHFSILNSIVYLHNYIQFLTDL